MVGTTVELSTCACHFALCSGDMNSRMPPTAPAYQQMRHSKERGGSLGSGNWEKAGLQAAVPASSKQEQRLCGPDASSKDARARPDPAAGTAGMRWVPTAI